MNTVFTSNTATLTLQSSSVVIGGGNSTTDLTQITMQLTNSSLYANLLTLGKVCNSVEFQELIFCAFQVITQSANGIPADSKLVVDGLVTMTQVFHIDVVFCIFILFYFRILHLMEVSLRDVCCKN